jgi:hypothetical protein
METDKSMTRPVLRRPDDDNDGLVALPPIPLVRQRLRSTVKDFAVSQPGRRAAALAAVWIAATGCEADLGHYDAEEALRTYRLIESELRAELLEIPNASHTAPIEHPHLVGFTVRDFLARRVDNPALEPLESPVD